MSKGAVSNTNYDTNHTQDHYKPYLIEDLRHKVNISFDQFLKHILKVPSDWIPDNASHIQQAIKERSYIKMVQEYAQPIGHETERYHPFVTLVNHIIAKLRKINRASTPSEFEVTFCRSDPTVVRGSHASRRPDIAVVDLTIAQLGERGGVDDMSLKGPKDQPFFWDELLSFFEHKQTKEALEFALDDVVSIGTGGKTVSGELIPQT